MFKDENITLRREIIVLTRYKKTIVARCDLGSMGFVHSRGKMAPSALPRVPFSPSGVQNAIDPVTACNNCILLFCGLLDIMYFMSCLLVNLDGTFLQ